MFLDMELKAWRKLNQLTVEDLAHALGPSRSARSISRAENGENHPDADMVARIQNVTDGAVTAADMHATRLTWLKANRPEKFDGAVTFEATEAAE